MAARQHGLILIILLLGAWLRFHALGWDARFHPDEALFATFARSAAVQGDWLLHGALDKPPLSIYAGALSMTFFGVMGLPNGVLTLDIHAGEFAARIPGVIASFLLLPLVYSISHRLHGRQSALFALALAAFCPYLIAFAATAFTDGLMLLLLVAGLCATVSHRPLVAGICLGLAFWSKPQALYYLPLLTVLYITLFPPTENCPHKHIFVALRLLIPVAMSAALLAAWDIARAQPTGFWALSAANNDPGRLARPDELMPRLGAWLGYAGYLFGTTWLSVPMLLAAAFARRSRVNGILLLYVLAYLLLHWLVAFNIYDRYLLPIVPTAILLAADGLARLRERFMGTRHTSSLQAHPDRMVRFVSTIPVLFLVVCLLFSTAATERQLPIGADRGQHSGIDMLGRYLDSKPLGTIIYDRWLGWELGYYLGTWSDKRRVYHPTPEALLADARTQPDPAPRYFPAFIDSPIALWLEALRSADFGITPVYNCTPFVVYELIPPQAAVATAPRLPGKSASNAESSWPGLNAPCGG